MERHFSRAENYSVNQNVVGDNALNNSPQKRNLCNGRDRSSAREVEIINFDELNIDSPPKKRARTNRFTAPRNMIARTVKKSSDGSRPL